MTESDVHERPCRPFDWWQETGSAWLEAWRELAAFVESLVHHYSLQLVILPCWWQHGEAVDELTALLHARRAYLDKPTGTNSAMQWRDAFVKCRGRLSGVFTSCREGHVESAIPNWMSDDKRKELERFLRAGVDLTDLPGETGE